MFLILLSDLGKRTKTFVKETLGAKAKARVWGQGAAFAPGQREAGCSPVIFNDGQHEYDVS